MDKAFQFKEFTIEQNRCAMKIGTDGVLLGAWVSLETNPFSVLDIGSGTGIIALQLAQRSDVELIDALEIDEERSEEHTSELQSRPHLVCRLLLEKKKQQIHAGAVSADGRPRVRLRLRALLFPPPHRRHPGHQACLPVPAGPEHGTRRRIPRVPLQ